MAPRKRIAGVPPFTWGLLGAWAYWTDRWSRSWPRRYPFETYKIELGDRVLREMIRQDYLYALSPQRIQQRVTGFFSRLGTA